MPPIHSLKPEARIARVAELAGKLVQLEVSAMRDGLTRTWTGKLLGSAYPATGAQTAQAILQPIRLEDDGDTLTAMTVADNPLVSFSLATVTQIAPWDGS